MALTDQELQAIDGRIEERCQMATTGLVHFENESMPTVGLSEEMEQLFDGLRGLAYRMCGDVHTSEENEVDAAFNGLLGTIEGELKMLATSIELARREKAAAA